MNDKCTCSTIEGPRMEDTPGWEMCPSCVAFHDKYFPAFPGDINWRLNHGAINRNGWGILAKKFSTRRIERVSDFQLEAAQIAIHEAEHELVKLQIRRDINDAYKPLFV